MTTTGGPETQRPGRRPSTDPIRALTVTLATMAVLVFVLWGIDGARTPPATTTTTTTSSTVPTINRASYRVQVYNGTTVNGAAGSTTNKLHLDGWATLPAVQSNTTVVSSIVAYAPGDRAAALLCATDLGLSSNVVEPLTTSTANPAPATGTNLVVIIGPDLAS